MKHQRRFAPKGGRNESELVAGFIGISKYLRIHLLRLILNSQYSFFYVFPHPTVIEEKWDENRLSHPILAFFKHNIVIFMAKWDVVIT